MDLILAAGPLVILAGLGAGLLLFLFVGRAIAMWWLGIDELLAELRTSRTVLERVAGELEGLRRDIAAINAPQAGPPAS